MMKMNKNVIPICIDAQNKRQTIDGWGTTLCWWANIIGNWQNEAKINEIADLLFSHERGLGINIIRYNIGAGKNPVNRSNLRIGANMPCFQSKQGKWNWETDMGQRKILFMAKDRDVDTFEAFSNAPPAWMTKNGSTSGSTDRRNNLKDDMYGEFAEFLTSVIKHFKDNWDITFSTLSPFNEPISCWWHDHNDQEGCFFDTDKQIELIREIMKRLKYKGLTETTITGPECWSVFESIYAYGCYTDEIKSCMKQINTHGYSGDSNSRTFLKSVAEKEGKKLWMAETSCGGTEVHNHNDISSALELAKAIRDYLMEMNASAWVYWQAVENEGLNHNHGFIHANFTGKEEYWITKQYYAFANYSKFIKKGAWIIHTGDQNMVAAYDEKKGELIIVIINDEDVEKEYICDLTSFQVTGTAAAVFRTSARENLVKLENIPIDNKILKLRITEKSISTFSIHSVRIN